MIILIDLCNYDSLSQGQGQYRYMIDFLNGISKIQSGFKFILIGSKEVPIPEIRNILSSGSNFEYIFLKMTSTKFSRFRNMISRLWILYTHKHDIYHSIGFFVPCFPPKKCILTMYDMMYEMFDDYKEARASKIYKTYKRFTKRFCDKIVCISLSTKLDSIKYWKLNPDLLTVIYPSKDCFYTKIIDNSLPVSALSNSSNHFIILSPFGLEPRKNMAMLLESFSNIVAQYPNVSLVLYGNAGWSKQREDDYNSIIDKLKISKSVIRTGLITDAELFNWYATCDLFVFPSLYEGFGYPVLEAMSHGKCVIARNISSMKEIIDDCGILVEPLSEFTLRTAMIRAYLDSNLRLKLGRMAKERSNLFSNDRMAREYINLYKTI